MPDIFDDIEIQSTKQSDIFDTIEADSVKPAQPASEWFTVKSEDGVNYQENVGGSRRIEYINPQSEGRYIRRQVSKRYNYPEKGEVAIGLGSWELGPDGYPIIEQNPSGGPGERQNLIDKSNRIIEEARSAGRDIGRFHASGDYARLKAARHERPETPKGQYTFSTWDTVLKGVHPWDIVGYEAAAASFVAEMEQHPDFQQLSADQQQALKDNIYASARGAATDVYNDRKKRLDVQRKAYKDREEIVPSIEDTSALQDLGAGIAQGSLGVLRSVAQTANTTADYIADKIWGGDAALNRLRMQREGRSVHPGTDWLIATVDDITSDPTLQRRFPEDWNKSVKGWLKATPSIGGQTIGYMLPAVVAGGIFGKGAGEASAFLTGYSAGFDQIYSASKAEGTSEDKAILSSLGGGLLYAAIEQFQFKDLNLFGGGRKAVAEAAAKQIAGKLAKGSAITKDLLRQSIREGLEEVTQSLTVESFVKIPAGKKVDLDAMADQLASDFIGGFTMGMVLGAKGAIFNNLNSSAANITQQINAGDVKASTGEDIQAGQERPGDIQTEAEQWAAEAAPKAKAQEAQPTESTTPTQEITNAVQEQKTEGVSLRETPQVSEEVGQEVRNQDEEQIALAEPPITTSGEPDVFDEIAAEAPVGQAAEIQTEATPAPINQQAAEIQPESKPATPEAKQPWEIRKKEWTEARQIELISNRSQESVFELARQHRFSVQSAIKDKLPVPLEVLRDYAGEKWADDALAKIEGKPAATPQKETPNVETQSAADSLQVDGETARVGGFEVGQFVETKQGQRGRIVEFTESGEASVQSERLGGGIRTVALSDLTAVDLAAEDAARRASLETVDTGDPAVQIWAETKPKAKTLAEKITAVKKIKHAKAGIKKYVRKNPASISKKPIKSSDDKIAAILKAARKAPKNSSAELDSSHVVTGYLVDGGKIVATDGHRLWIQDGATDKADGVYGSDGKPIKGNFPKYQDIVPTDKSLSKPVSFDAATVFNHINQAALMTNEDSKGVAVLLNTDGTLGFTARAPEIGEAEINVYDGAKILFAANPQFLTDAIEWHVRNGDSSLSLQYSEHNKPFIIRGKNGKTLSVTMPVELDTDVDVVPVQPVSPAPEVAEKVVPKAVGAATPKTALAEMSDADLDKKVRAESAALREAQDAEISALNAQRQAINDERQEHYTKSGRVRKVRKGQNHRDALERLNRDLEDVDERLTEARARHSKIFRDYIDNDPAVKEQGRRSLARREQQKKIDAADRQNRNARAISEAANIESGWGDSKTDLAAKAMMKYFDRSVLIESKDKEYWDKLSDAEKRAQRARFVIAAEKYAKELKANLDAGDIAAIRKGFYMENPMYVAAFKELTGEQIPKHHRDAFFEKFFGPDAYGSYLANQKAVKDADKQTREQKTIDANLNRKTDFALPGEKSHSVTYREAIDTIVAQPNVSIVRAKKGAIPIVQAVITDTDGNRHAYTFTDKFHKNYLIQQIEAKAKTAETEQKAKLAALPPKRKGLVDEFSKDEAGGLGVQKMNEVFGAAGKAIADTGKSMTQGLRKAWKSVITLPWRAMKNIPDGNPIASIRDFLGHQLSGEYGRSPYWIARRRRARGGDREARLIADRMGAQFIKACNEANVDWQAPETQMLIEDVLRGKADAETLADPIKAWAMQARAQLDTEARYAAQQFRAVGLDSLADVYEQNIGEYMKNIPLRQLRPAKALRHFIGQLLGERLTKSFGKMKRDKWAVKVDGKATKYETEQEARDAYKAAVDDKKKSLITKKGQAKGVNTADIYRQAARRVELIEPIPEEWRIKNEIHNPAYLVARSIIETRHNAEMVHLFDYAAKKWGQQAPVGSQEEIDAWAEENKLDKLPETDRLHNLKGMYVPKGIAEDLKEMVRAPSTAEKLYRAYLTAWKSSKTLYNPATHARNVMGNFVFSYVGGASIWNPANAPHYLSAIKDLIQKGDDYSYLVKHGILGTEYYGTELKRIERSILGGGDLSRLDQALAGLKAIHGAVGSIYAAEDQIFKLAAYKIYRNRGMTPARAAAEVDKWFPNYDRIGKLTRILKSSPYGAPFLSFLDQSVRIAGRAVAEHPIRVAIIASLPQIISYFSAMALGMSDEEKALIDEARSYWEPIVPMRDDKGRAMTFDMRYIVPLANDLVPETRGEGLRLPWAFQNPIMQFAVEQMTGRDMFMGRSFVPSSKDATDEEKRNARLMQGIKTLAPLPTWAMPVKDMDEGGYSPYMMQRFLKAKNGDETMARAILGMVGGVNIRKAHVSEDKAKELIRNAILEDEPELANKILELWNERYKPGYKNDLTINGIKAGMKQSDAYYWRRYRDRAAEKLLAGNESGAKEILAEYAKKHPGGNKLELRHAESSAERMRRRGRTR